MPIRASSAGQIDVLLRDLSADAAVRRETAIARLTVLGARAVDGLLRVIASDATSGARVAALRAIEAIGDARSATAVLAAVDDDDADVATAAATAARAFLSGAHETTVLDRLTAVALDRRRAERVRLAAAQALSDLDASTVAPVWRALADEDNDAIRAFARARAAGRAPAVSDDPASDLRAAAEATLPDDPVGLTSAIARAGDTAAPATLHALVNRIRTREGAVEPTVRPDWVAARGAAHAALARRGSRLALYDLRESVDAAEAPLPPAFLAALAAVGDPSCLETVASAYARAIAARTTGSGPWRQRLADAFRAIAARERVTRRHAALKRIEKRWPGLLARLLP